MRSLRAVLRVPRRTHHGQAAWGSAYHGLVSEVRALSCTQSYRVRLPACPPDPSRARRILENEGEPSDMENTSKSPVYGSTW